MKRKRKAGRRRAVGYRLAPRSNRQNPSRCAAACEMLFEHIDGDTSPPRNRVVLTRLIVRGSGEIAPELDSAAA
jgi:DNA-binding LacI/PurR family transcriptional regulator